MCGKCVHETEEKYKKIYAWFKPSPFSAVGDVGFTVDTSKARSAGAGVRVNIVRACASIFTGGALAFVDFHSTALPSEPWEAAAVEGIHIIYAGSTI